MHDNTWTEACRMLQILMLSFLKSCYSYKPIGSTKTVEHDRVSEMVSKMQSGKKYKIYFKDGHHAVMKFRGMEGAKINGDVVGNDGGLVFATVNASEENEDGEEE